MQRTTRCDVVSYHVILPASRFHLKRFPMPLSLSVYHEDRERIGGNNSSHILLRNSSRPVRTMTLLIVFSVLLVAGCASERSSKKPSSDRTFFDSPDLDSLHYLDSGDPQRGRTWWMFIMDLGHG